MPDVLERGSLHGSPYEVPKGWCVMEGESGETTNGSRVETKVVWTLISLATDEVISCPSCRRCGFGLKVPPRAHDIKVFAEWAVSFHGCPSNVLPSILKEGQLLMPGDTLIDGTVLPNRLTRGSNERIGLYTSPSIGYIDNMR